mmetsp:Transcript_39004/g.79866  ORF Transcript_39004/g.79866 Transcript_39004/m.79866 type:complete len:80 (-) Transcript_39004:261-500(-)
MYCAWRAIRVCSTKANHQAALLPTFLQEAVGVPEGAVYLHHAIADSNRARAGAEIIPFLHQSPANRRDLETSILQSCHV